jgi:MoxR-like ATPase
MPPADQPPPFELIHRPQPGHRPEAARELLARRPRPPSLDPAKTVGGFRPGEDHLLAINTALHVGAPLLLTGEPGTGKTVTAAFIAEFFAIPLYSFQVKSTSTAEDLKYDFDAVGYLHWAQSDRDSSTPHRRRDFAYKRRVGQGAAKSRRDFLQKRALWEAYECPTEAVLLIDEIDKAPRDFPNDLLHELDQHRFTHPFDDTEVIEPACGRPPILVITSNDERRLPDAFLRRCIFHRIELTETLVRDATEAHLDDFPRLDEEARKAARKRFWELRDSGIDKNPSTAELLVWLCILSALGVDAETLRVKPLAELPGIGALIKDDQDLKALG